MGDQGLKVTNVILTKCSNEDRARVFHHEIQQGFDVDVKFMTFDYLLKEIFENDKKDWPMQKLEGVKPIHKFAYQDYEAFKGLIDFSH